MPTRGIATFTGDAANARSRNLLSSLQSFFTAHAMLLMEEYFFGFFSETFFGLTFTASLICPYLSAGRLSPALRIVSEAEPYLSLCSCPHPLRLPPAACLDRFHPTMGQQKKCNLLSNVVNLMRIALSCSVHFPFRKHDINQAVRRLLRKVTIGQSSGCAESLGIGPAPAD